MSIEVNGNLDAAFDQVVEHNLQGGNHGGRGLQVDSTSRTTETGPVAIRRKPSQLVVGRTEDSSRRLSLVLILS